MKTHAYALQLDGGIWFAGFSGRPDETGEPRVNMHGELSKARFFRSATEAELAAAKLASRSYKSSLYVLRVFAVNYIDSKANDTAIGLARRRLAKAAA